MTVAHYARTRAQDQALGLIEEGDEDTGEGAVGQDDGEGLNTLSEVRGINSVLQFRKIQKDDFMRDGPKPMSNLYHEKIPNQIELFDNYGFIVKSFH